MQDRENDRIAAAVPVEAEDGAARARKGRRKKGKAKKSFLREVMEWIESLAAAVVIVLIITNFLFTLIRVDGKSMYPTLDNGERLFVTVADVKFAGAIHRDDVVICHYPGRTSKFLGIITQPTLFVKRVVAVPGDTVYRKGGVNYVVYTNDAGETVTEALDADVLHYGADYDPVTLGKNEYFVVGDNRGNSHDSRDWNGWDYDASNDVGPITLDMIVGHVRSVIWPLGAIRGVK